MLVTITYEPDGGPDADATELGFLLRKHPRRVQTFTAPVGEIHVFYPEAAPERCTVAMLLEVDPVGLARSKRFRGDPRSLGHYVNDRPYAASSMLAVALSAVFSTAMTGRSETHPELAAAALPLRIEIPAVPVRRGDGELARRLFEGCGWEYDERPIALDPAYPEWGPSPYGAVTLTGRVRLAEALRQLYVLLPVLDDTKHYWVGDAEVEKLARAGEGWLAQHPERELIARRYLLDQRELVAQVEWGAGAEGSKASADAGKPAAAPLRVQRAEAVLAALRDVRAESVVDLGCGPGALLTRLASDRSLRRIVGCDVSASSLERAARTLQLDRASDAERERIVLLHGSAVYRDDRLRGFDALVLMEVVEHIDPSRLPALEDAVFAHAAPSSVIVTTPNSEYNARYPDLGGGAMRHDDHRFEWSRSGFREWAGRVARSHGYAVEFRPVGDEDPQLGPPTQLALFRRESGS